VKWVSIVSGTYFFVPSSTMRRAGTGVMKEGIAVSGKEIVLKTPDDTTASFLGEAQSEVVLASENATQGQNITAVLPLAYIAWVIGSLNVNVNGTDLHELVGGVVDVPTPAGSSKAVFGGNGGYLLDSGLTADDVSSLLFDYLLNVSLALPDAEETLLSIIVSSNQPMQNASVASLDSVVSSAGGGGGEVEATVGTEAAVDPSTVFVKKGL